MPRIHFDLAEQGVRVGRKRVARLMKAVGLQEISRRKWTRTTVRCPGASAAPDLVDRDFTTPEPDRLWVADITYIPTWIGFLYLAVVLDIWSRRVLGWAMATHLRTELVLDAPNMAILAEATQRSRSSLGSRDPVHLDRLRTPSEYGRPWDRSATATTMRWPRASSRRSSASVSIGTDSRPRPTRGWP